MTEDELDHGIFKVPVPNAVSLCYTRTLSNLSAHLADDGVMRYIDTCSSNQLDVKAQEMLSDLKWTKVPGVLDKSNIHHYKIQWIPGGVCESNHEHAQYLSQVCEQVYHDIKRLIENAKNLTGNSDSEMYLEVLHHAQLSKTKNDSYCDRKDGVMASVKAYIQRIDSDVPLIIHGKSGSGKTSIMAKIPQLLPLWLNGQFYCIVRFLGTSPVSSTLRGLLVSIIEQVSELFGTAVPDLNDLNTVNVVQLFRNEVIPSLRNSNSKVILLLDSVDQLSSSDGAHSMKWLPQGLPSNVKVIVSVLDEKHNCLENLKSFRKSGYINVGHMHSETGQEIMTLWLSKIGRTVTEAQNAIIWEAFLACPQPLFLRLLFGHARTWKSYTDLSSIKIPKSTGEALSQFYDGLEVQFGKILVQKALGYLTASKHGLTEAELEDVLSLDNEVLDDVYQYWDPPLQGVIRIPSLLWKRIRQYIDDYIVEQQAQGMIVLRWYHRQFIESATKRYVLCQSTILHFILSEYFSGTWANGRSKSVKLTHRDIYMKDSVRQVAMQPLLFGKTVYNFRKLTELPYHLLYSEQIEELRNKVLCNYEWVYTKLKATGYVSLMQDYITTLGEHKDDNDISLMCEALSLSGSNIRNNPDMLAGQLIARLYPFKCDKLKKITLDADTWLTGSSKCHFRPMNKCLISPGGELKSTLSGHPQVVLAIKQVPSPSFPLLVSYSKAANKVDNLFHVWNISTLECIENINTFTWPGSHEKPLSKFVVSSDHLIAVNESSSYMVWNLKSGSSDNHTVNVADDVQLSCVAITSDASNLVLGTKTGTLLFTPLHFSGSKCQLMELQKEIKEIFISLDDLYIVVLAGNDDILTVEVDKQELVAKLIHNHYHFDSKIIFSTDTQSFFVAGTHDGKLFIFNMPHLQVSSVEAHSKAIKCIVRIPSLNSIVTGSLDKVLHVWNLSSCSCSQTLKGHCDGVWCASSIPGTNCVISGSKDDYLKVWDVISGECLHTLEGHSSWISCVTAISPDVMVSGSNDKKLKFWNLNRNRRLAVSARADRHNAHPECVLLRNNSLAISGAQDGIKMWSPYNGKCLQSFDSPGSCLAAMEENNLSMIISGNIKGTMEIYSVLNRSAISVYKIIKSAHSAKITVLLSHKMSENMLVSSSLDSTLKVWNSQFDEVSTMRGHTAGVLCMAIFCNVLVSGSKDADIRIWNVLSSKCIGLLKGHTKTVNCVTFAANNTRIISGSDDFSVRVWSVDECNCLHVIKYFDSIKCICPIDSQGIFIAGAHSAINQLKSWDTYTGNYVKNFVGHSHAVMCMLNINKSHILTGSRDGTVRIWNVCTAIMLGSFDLQSQVKYISISKMSDNHYILAATTMSGPVAFLQFTVEE